MASRYYDSCNSEGEIRPGRISKELREALDISENDLPIWIYRMRVLGYPPGWLKKAIVDTSDIFDTDAAPSEAANKEDNKNDKTGEGSNKRKRSSPEPSVQYDHSKLIEYPGFNTPMPENCSDYHYFLNMPAMIDYQQLEYAKKHLCAFKPAELPKRAKFDTSTEPDDDSTDDKSTTNILSADNDQEGPASPDAEESSIDATSGSDPGEGSKKEEVVIPSGPSMPEEIKLLSKGSPMPKPVERPSLEKFSEGVVGELLYFENIPSSTGKFDSIRGLLNSIRKSSSKTEREEIQQPSTPLKN